MLQDGFPVENQADAVFLDIPQPDEAMKQAAKALKNSGSSLVIMVSTFSKSVMVEILFVLAIEIKFRP